jgi:hypothetical protein
LMIERTGRQSPLRVVSAIALLVLVVLGAGLVTELIAPPMDWTGSLGAWLDFYGGVLALVALSLASMTGLAASDRMFLSRRMRLRLQRGHRTLAVITMGFLIVHIVTRVADGHVGLLDATLPFRSGGVPAMVHLGTVAAYLLVLVAATGAARSRLAGRGPGAGSRAQLSPTLWRAVHAISYLSWPIAIMHGLTSGRHAAPWVMFGYAACLTATGVSLIARWLLGPVVARRRSTAVPAATGYRRHTVFRGGRSLAAALAVAAVALAVGVGVTVRRSSTTELSKPEPALAPRSEPASTPKATRLELPGKARRSKPSASTEPGSASTRRPAAMTSPWRTMK